METEINNSSNEWRIMQSKNSKRKNGQTENSDTEGKTKIHKSHEFNLITSNRFEVLENDNSTNNIKNINTVKSPPIYVHDVININPMIYQLNLINSDGYTLKILNNNQVKIMPKSSECYSLIINELNKNSIAFHTYQLKQDRCFRVVLKNLHHSTNLDELKKEIESYEHNVTRISNIKQKTTKTPLPMFFIDLAPNSNNKLIYDIKYLQHMKIIFEPPHYKKEIVQCHNCQRFGHTKKYCSLNPRCVKCSQEHHTTECLKDKNTKPTCIHCKGDHSANYKGCPFYKELINKKFSNNRKNNPQTSSQDNMTSIKNNSSRFLYNQDISYAQKTKPTTSNSENTNTSNSNTENLDQHINQNTNLNNIEQTINKLVEKIDTLLNIITIIVNKIK